MARKGALGKGLSALIPEDIEETKKASLEINIDNIFPNKKQPRAYFDEEKMDTLGESIKEHGIIQPIIVKKEGDFYKIVAGERRWRAAKKVGLKTVPIIEKELSDGEIAEISLIENIQRENLNPIEEALAYQRLSKEFKLTQEEISKKVGKSRSAITNNMRLLNLNNSVKDFLINGDISEGHGKIIAGVENKDVQLKIAEKVINEELNVRQTERLIKEWGKEATPKKKPTKDIHVKSVEEKLEDIFGTKVNINKGKKKSKIEIEFYSEDDLERILSLISNEK